MRTRAASGVLWLASAQAAKIFLSFLATFVLARVLTPDQFGVGAMVAPLLVLLTLFQDMGLGTAAIQAKSLSWDQSNALFWLNIFIALVLAVVLVVSAPLVGWFYGDTRAAYLTAASGASMIVWSFGIQHSALLSRELRFTTLAIADIVNQVLTYAVAIGVALITHNYWALFLGPLVGSLTQTAIWVRASGFRPGMPAVRGVGELARFGGHVTGFAATNFLVRNVDKVLVARLSGASAAGLYDRSYRLMMMPLQSITGPLYRLLEPMMARLWSAPERYRRAFLLACRAVVLLTVPGVIVAAVLSERLMPWLLGANWAGAGAIFFWLGLAAVLQPVGNLTGLLFLTSQQSRAMMHWGFVSAITTLIGFAVGAHWGAVGIAASFFWTSLLRLPLLFAWCTRTTPVRAMDLWKVQIEPLIGATICALAAVRLWGGMPFLPLFAVTLVLAYIGAALTSCISRQGRQETIELAQLGAEHLRTMLGRIFPTLRSREA